MKIILTPVLRCVSCEETDPGCDAEATNEKVVDCQLDNKDGPHYGNACSVGHTRILHYLICELL